MHSIVPSDYVIDCQISSPISHRKDKQTIMERDMWKAGISQIAGCIPIQLLKSCRWWCVFSKSQNTYVHIMQLYTILFVRNIETKYYHFDILCLITLVYSEVFGICHMIFDRYPTCNLSTEGNSRGVVLWRVEFSDSSRLNASKAEPNCEDTNNIFIITYL